MLNLLYQKTYSQINLVATSGTLSGSYTTLRNAFNKINDGTHKGTIVITITDNSTDNATAILNASGTGNAIYSSVLIYPTISGKKISSNVIGATIQLNGADNVTIDGRLNASGSNIDLAICNTALSGDAANAITFINDASNNVVKYCNLKSGGGLSYNAVGIINFSTTTGTTGNDNNIIEYNNISSISNDNRPIYGIYSLGTDSYENSGNIIRYNNIFDFFDEADFSFGICIKNNSTNYEIIGNSFYETNEFVPNSSMKNYYVIYVNTGPLGNNFKINNNYIGGSAPQCGGVNKWRKTNVCKSDFYGIYLRVGNVIASNVQGNTIKNISWHNPTESDFYGIYAEGGTINIGTTQGNSIGSTDENSVIELKSDVNAYAYGIYVYKAKVDARNNKIGGFTLLNTNNSYNYNFCGIKMSNTAYPFKCVNNTIGSTTLANNINCTSNATNNAQLMTGISSSSSILNEITENTIANLTNNSTNSTTSSDGGMKGIFANYGACIINNNTIRDFKIYSAGAYENINGIDLRYGNSDTSSVSNNTIFNLANYNDSYSGTISGITLSNKYYTEISRNYIHSLSVSNNTTDAKIVGIEFSGNLSVFNNLINLNNSSKSTIYGFKSYIVDNTNIYFNTVFLKGNVTSGSNRTYAYFCVFSSDEYLTIVNNVKNNIFYNSKSTIGGNNLHLAASFSFSLGSNGVFSLDYNNYIANGEGGRLGYFNSNFISSLPFKIGQDVNSLIKDPVFANSSGLNATDFKPTTPLKGIAIDGYTTDFEFQTLLSPPSMGAFKGVGCQNASNAGSIGGTQTVCYNTIPLLFTNETSPSGNNSTLVYKWQKSTTSETSGFSDIENSNASTYQSTALKQDTWFKRLAISDCADWSGAVESNVIKVSVSPSTVGGSITSSTTSITYGSSSGTMTLESHVGNIQKWQKKLNNGTWSDISNTNTTYSETPSNAGTWYYRAVVKSGTCSEANSSEFTLTVNKKQLTAINATVSTKIYDGSTTASISNAELSGVLLNDVVTLENATIGSFENKNVGTNKVVNSAMYITGADATNYQFVQPSLTGNITTKELTIGGDFTVLDKVHDGNDTATINQNNLTMVGKILNDNVNLNNIIVKFAQTAIGTNIVVSITHAELDGTDKNNYTLSLNAAPTATASITTGSNVNIVNKNIINLYPNPFINVVYIEDVQNIKKIQITNIAGQLVLEKNLINEKLIRTENLENGVYFIHIETNNGEKQIIKMIKY